MRTNASFLLVLAGGLAAGMAAAQPAPPAGPPKPSPVKLTCAVDPGPRYSDCAASNPQDFQPDRLKEAIERTEAMPSCMILKGSPGERVEVKADVYDRPVGRVSYVLNPDWDARTLANVIEQVYPEKAFQGGVSGHVSISCEIDEHGKARQCHVLSESPVDYGFGSASLELSRMFRFNPMLKDCKPVGGAEVVLPVDYNVVRPFRRKGVTAPQPAP